MSCKIFNGDSLDVMRKLTADSIHSCVTDPPYGLSFMGKEWDRGIPPLEYWQEAYRVLKPGGYLLAFGGSRTYHRLACLIEDAGFEIRDSIIWMYGSGFPKGTNIAKAIDKKLGKEPEVVGENPNWRPTQTNSGGFDKLKGGEFVEQYKLTAPTSELAKQWEGWNTNLKPAYEPIIMARKPLEGTVVDNVIKHGTGGINIDECRVGGEPSPAIDRRESCRKAGKSCFNQTETSAAQHNYAKDFANHKPAEELGRYPANLIHDGSDEVLEQFPNSKSKNLKPAYESIIMARKPLEGTVVDNVIKHGTGGINIDECRVGETGATRAIVLEDDANRNATNFEHKNKIESIDKGRYPANLIHDGSEEVLEEFPNSKSTVKKNAIGARNDGKSIYGKFNDIEPYQGGYDDSGSAARFFYCAKASVKDRNEGCENIEKKQSDESRETDGKNMVGRPTTLKHNNHPTVKPTSLMQYLCKLVTPKNGIVLDPFMGSGSTGKAAVLEGFNFIGIELSKEYCDIAKSRIEYIKKELEVVIEVHE